MGWFPEGGRLDRLDKAVSLPWFKTELPAPLEFALSIPGTWCGLPFYVWGFWPLFLNLRSSTWRTAPFANHLGAAQAALFGLFTCYWAYLCSFKHPKDGGPMLAMRPGIGFLLMGLSVAVTRTWADDPSPSMFLLNAWFAMTNGMSVVKYTAVRTRPAACMKRDLAKVRRALPVLGIQFASGQTVIESFFSGDAAGSGLIATTSVLLGHSNYWLLMPVLTGLGRMYIHAHHALDVVIGALFGSASALVYNQVWPIRSASMHHFFASLLVFIAWQLACRKMKPVLPTEHARDWSTPTGAHDS